ncbi:S-adenosyl-L-methionine-dependent methyltransferase [Stipitochalara longipes BDJ]|nr:S-adenosyl-L-methionine-dependent methyltransferase [Stipitochalara longipes BDJ]
MAENQGESGQHSSKQIVEDGYDHMAARYLEWTTSQPSPRTTYLEKLLALLSKDIKPKALELGCGAGVPGTQILAASCDVTANDISKAQIELAKKNVPGATFVHGDIMSLEFEKGAFDAVVAFYSIIHLPREEQEVLMGRIARWLTEGGLLLMNLGARDNPGSVNLDWLGSSMYWSSYDAETNKTIIQKAGLEILHGDVIEEEEDGRLVPFLWVLARKRSEL